MFTAFGSPRRRGLPKDDGLRSVIADNLLDRQFTAEAPNQRWIADFTYIWTAEGGTGQGSDDVQHRWKAGGGWLYVAVVIDLFSRRVVGWSMSDTMTAQLVTDALMMAIWRRGKPDALLHHSDQGGAAQGSGDAQHRWNGCGRSQYTSEQFQRLMADNGVACSMSRSRNVWDNAGVNRRRTGTPDRRRTGTPWGRWRTSIVRDCRAACDVGRA